MREVKMIDDKMRNEALAFALEWGPEMGKPLLGKMQTIYPQIEEATVAQLQKLCGEIKSFAWRAFEDAYSGKISEAAAERSVSEKYPFVSGKNLSHLHTQGMYYAWHG